MAGGAKSYQVVRLVVLVKSIRRAVMDGERFTKLGLMFGLGHATAGAFVTLPCNDGEANDIPIRPAPVKRTTLPVRVVLASDFSSVFGAGASRRAVVELSDLARGFLKLLAAMVTGKSYAFRLIVVFASVPGIPTGLRAEALLFCPVRHKRKRLVAL